MRSAQNTIVSSRKIRRSLTSSYYHTYTEKNITEHIIHTFKYHFLATIEGTDDALPYLWYLILEQVELTLNLPRQATINPCISSWVYFN